jgi:uroporphyrinogen decarboxylase
MHKRETADTAALSRGERSFNDSTRGMIESRADYDRYDWPAVDRSVAQSVIETAKLLPDHIKMVVDIQPGGVQETAIALMGYYAFSYALYEDEPLVLDVIERLSGDLLRSMEICFACAPGKIGAVVYGDDMGYNSGTIISPDFMRRLIFPYQRLHAGCAHRHDIPFILHSCGNVDAVMEDLIGYVGIGAKHSFQQGTSDIAIAKQKYGSRIALLGGIDMHKLCTLEESALRAYVREVFSACAPDRFAIGSGNSIANYVPLQNYFVMLDECNRLRFE